MGYLDFIAHMNPTAATNAQKMEELIFQDPSSSILKARIFTEEILKTVFEFEKLDVPYLSTLNDRILFLAREGFLTPEIQNALHTVRMIGNKAAHNGSYSDIVDAFKVHKVMYDIALWFYETYSIEEHEIPPYKYPQPQKNNLDNLEELIETKVRELLSHKNEIDKSNHDQELNPVNEDEDPEYSGSYLLRELRRLQDSSKEAIENASTFSQFKNYLHVERKIQQDLEELLESCKYNDSSNLVLLCGSVGDGKSHLLAYLKEHKPDLIEPFEIYNDATESFSPTKSSMETLREILKDFSDQAQPSNKKIILAINLGVLHNFITTEHDVPFTRLKSFIEKSNLFSSELTTSYSDGTFSLINFGDYHPFQLTNYGADSSFFKGLIEKICAPNDSNPFFKAYKKDLAKNIKTMAHINYKILQSPTVQNRLVQLIIQAIIKYKLVISARSFLNFIADIIIPDQVNLFDLLNDFERLEHSLPTLLFKRKDRSQILKYMNELNPIHFRNPVIDNTIIQLNTLKDWNPLINNLIPDEDAKSLVLPFVGNESHGENALTDQSFFQFSETFILLAYLTNDDFAEKTNDPNYQTYLQRLYYFNTGNVNQMKTLYEEVKRAVFYWKGSPKKDYIYLNKAENSTYRLAQKLNLKPDIEHIKKNEKPDGILLDVFKSTLIIAYSSIDHKKTLFLDIDFPLYEMIQRVLKGYRPNKNDEEVAIKFTEFIDKLMHFGDKQNELLIHEPVESKYYKLYRDDFGTLVFEKGT